MENLVNESLPCPGPVHEGRICSVAAIHGAAINTLWRGQNRLSEQIDGMGGDVKKLVKLGFGVLVTLISILLAAIVNPVIKNILGG